MVGYFWNGLFHSLRLELLGLSGCFALKNYSVRSWFVLLGLELVSIE